MPIYKAPVDEMLFLLTDVFQIGRYNNLPGFADAAPDHQQKHNLSKEKYLALAACPGSAAAARAAFGPRGSREASDKR